MSELYTNIEVDFLKLSCGNILTIKIIPMQVVSFYNIVRCFKESIIIKKRNNICNFNV